MVQTLRSSFKGTATQTRGASPDDHGSGDSSSDDEQRPVEKIRVGRDYQAVCPKLEPLEKRRPELIPDQSYLHWIPNPNLSDAELDEFISFANKKHGYTEVQALGMLAYHKHDMKLASQDMANYVAYVDEWTVEDKALFEKAFRLHGKNFQLIRIMIPYRSIASLVEYYYSWKKTEARRLLDVGGKAGRSGSSAGNRENSQKETDKNKKVKKHKRKVRSKSWSNEELLTAINALRKYGKDFRAIAEILGTKTEANVRRFFISYRRRYDLDTVLREHDADFTHTGSKRKDNNINNNPEDIGGGALEIEGEKKAVDTNDVTIRTQPVHCRRTRHSI